MEYFYSVFVVIFLTIIVALLKCELLLLLLFYINIFAPQKKISHAGLK